MIGREVRKAWSAQEARAVAAPVAEYIMDAAPLRTHIIGNIVTVMSRESCLDRRAR
jgi:hypothetical protein